LRLKNLLLFVFILGYLNCFCQSNDASWVIGAEHNLLINQSKQYLPDFNSLHRISISKPINQFSVGIGAGVLTYREQNFTEFTGNVNIIEKKSFKENRYEAMQGNFNLKYLNISPRIIYRMPCNCVYLYAAINLDYLYQIQKKETYTYNSKYYFMPYTFDEDLQEKKLNTSFELGIGHQLHITELLRVTLRPTIVFSNSPTRADGIFFKGGFNYIQMTVAIEHGIK